MAFIIQCGPCGYEDNIKNAKKWCTDCEEGFCEECEKVHRSTKMSRNHNLISVSDYQKIRNVSISQTCVGHGKRYELYCSLHDKPLCIDCVDHHKSCSQLVCLENAAANAKQSTSLADLENTINAALKNVGKCITSQESTGKGFEEKESYIKKNIHETREKLNKHLDLLEQKTVQNLSTKSFYCKLAYSEILDQLNFAYTKLSQLKREIETMKQMASDVQVFLATSEINKTVSDEIQSIKAIINRTKYFEIKIDVGSTVNSLLNCVDQLGIISVDEKQSELEFKDAKLDQAQKQVLVPTASTSRVIDLELKESLSFFDGDRKRVTSCSILQNDHIIIADYWEKERIMEYDEQGCYVQYIPCSDKPYYLTLIDSDRIAVTYLSKGYIDIINLNNKHVQKIGIGDSCRGISYQQGKLYVVQQEKGIVVLDLAGKILNTMKINTQNIYEIATAKDRIYYTNTRTNAIHCLNLIGKEMWVFKDKPVICPEGLTVTSDQDVFVAGYSSNNLSILKQNGLESEILLTETDGLIKPRAIYYNNYRNELLVCNERNGKAAVYKVIVG